MKKFDGILICTDLDGTLLRKDKSISQENIEAIEYFKNNGGSFTFITGRMPYYISDMYEKVKPNAPIGCINGGGVFDYPNSKYLWTMPLDPSAITLARSVCENIEGVGIQISCFNRAYFCRDNAAMERFRRITGIPKIQRDFDEVDEPIGKILFGDLDPNVVDKVHRHLQNHPMANAYEFTRSELTLCEILPKGISKATSLIEICRLLGIDIKRAIAVGDYNNDIGMIRAAGLGVAVSNATAEVKAVADLITCSNEDSAIARIISEIDQGIIEI